MHEDLRAPVSSMYHVKIVVGDIENEPLPCEAGCSTTTRALGADAPVEMCAPSAATAEARLEYRMPAPPPRLVPVRRGLTLHMEAPGPLRQATAWSLGP